MISVLQVEILSFAREQSPKLVIFEVSVVGGKCTAPPHETEGDPGVEISPLDPAHYAELDALLELVQRISERLGSFSRRYKTIPAALTTGLKRFTDALVRERGHLRETAAAPPTELNGGRTAQLAAFVTNQ